MKKSAATAHSCIARGLIRGVPVGLQRMQPHSACRPHSSQPWSHASSSALLGSPLLPAKLGTRGSARWRALTCHQAPASSLFQRHRAGDAWAPEELHGEGHRQQHQRWRSVIGVAQRDASTEASLSSADEQQQGAMNEGVAQMAAQGQFAGTAIVSYDEETQTLSEATGGASPAAFNKATYEVRAEHAWQCARLMSCRIAQHYYHSCCTAVHAAWCFACGTLPAQHAAEDRESGRTQ